MRFTTPTKAFEFLYDYIIKYGKEKSGTKYIKNVGFTIENPLDRTIKTDWRNFNETQDCSRTPCLLRFSRRLQRLPFPAESFFLLLRKSSWDQG